MKPKAISRLILVTSQLPEYSSTLARMLPYLARVELLIPSLSLSKRWAVSRTVEPNVLETFGAKGSSKSENREFLICSKRADDLFLSDHRLNLGRHRESHGINVAALKNAFGKCTGHGSFLPYS